MKSNQKISVLFMSFISTILFFSSANAGTEDVCIATFERVGQKTVYFTGVRCPDFERGAARNDCEMPAALEHELASLCLTFYLNGKGIRRRTSYERCTELPPIGGTGECYFD